MLYKKFLLSSHKKPAHYKQGFGLIELMVSVGIMALVSSVILVKNRSFNNALSLRNQAYEIAFSLREVQLMAVSATKESVSASKQYGVYFDVSGSPLNRQYRLFRDDSNSSTNRGWYDGADVTLGKLGALDSRFIIADIVDKNGNSLTGTALSVTFVRPNFDALFKIAANTTVTGPVYLKITPSDTSGYSVVPSRLVEITGTGQITVK